MGKLRLRVIHKVVRAWVQIQGELDSQAYPPTRHTLPPSETFTEGLHCA